MTTTKSHLITSETVEAGDVMWLGCGTLNMRRAEVATVRITINEQWGYTKNAHLTFVGEGEPDWTLLAGVIMSRA